jgi:hypothetical protein
VNGYWLTPIVSMDPVTLGADRMHCPASAEFENFRGKLQRVHPRLLPLFKAHLLLTDDSAEACGTEELAFSLEDPGDIVFDEKVFKLSHCAEAYLDRLLTAKEALHLLQKCEFNRNEREAVWAGLLLRWLEEGSRIVLLKEEK